VKQLEQGIILAGVHQWRPSIFEGWIPRTLIPIANRPLVDYGLDWFSRGGLQRVEICANSDTHALRSNFDRKPLTQAVKIDFYEDVFPRGPAGCIADALKHAAYDDVVVLDGTVIPTEIDIDAFIEAHQKSGAALTVAVADAARADEAANGNGQHKTAGCVPTGIYVFNRAAIERIPAKGYEDIKEMLIPRLHQAGLDVGMYPLPSAPIRVSNANACFVATRYALRQMYEQCVPPTGYRFIHGALVHDSAEIAENARLEGPCLIGPYARIEAGATLIGPTTIGERAHIGVDAIVCRSLLWEGAQVGSEAFIDRCILTHGAEIDGSGRAVHRIVHQMRSKTARRKRGSSL